jgi:hypothetical protein
VHLDASVATVDTKERVSAWRREAAARLPELWHDEDARQSIYGFLFEVLPFVRDAHRSGDEDALRRGYGFAEWCFRQGGELENAAAVAFYEHLFDSWDVHDDVLRWLDPRIIRECWSLLEARLNTEQLVVLRQRLNF